MAKSQYDFPAYVLVLRIARTASYLQKQTMGMQLAERKQFASGLVEAANGEGLLPCDYIDQSIGFEKRPLEYDTHHDIACIALASSIEKRYCK